MMSTRIGLLQPISRLVLAVLVVALVAAPSQAIQVLGTGTDSLLGGDLTDPEDDGVEANYVHPPTSISDLGGFNAAFFASNEEGFGGGEFAFNVFDNTLGPGNAKWCCGAGAGNPIAEQIVGAEFRRATDNEPQKYFLTHFTVSSANDIPNRDPRVWFIEGSNDGNIWEPVFQQNDPNAAAWTERLQVIRWDAGTDFSTQTNSYSMFRMRTTETGATSGAFFQVGEIEFFGELDTGGGGACAIGEAVLPCDGMVGLQDFEVILANFFQTTTAGRADGDVNFDGTVNYSDFRVWKDNRTASAAAAAAVPEPSCLILGSLLAAVGLLARRQSR